MSQSIFTRLANLALRHKWTIVGLWAVAVVVALPFAPRISSALKPGGFGSSDMESVRAEQLLSQKLNSQFTSVDIFFTSDKLAVSDPQFTAQAEAAIAPLTKWKLVTQVVPYTVNIHQISKDGHAAYTAVYLDTNADDAPKYLPGLRERVVQQHDLHISIGGGPVFYADIQSVSESDLKRAELIAFPFALLALLLVFRSLVAAGLPAAVGGCSVIVSLAVVYALALHTDISTFALNITTLFGLGLGVDYSLFMVNRYREELARGRTVEDAIRITMNTAGRAMAVSGTAVTIGLMGLLLFNFTVLRSIGLGGVLVVLVSILSAATLLPALLAIIGTHVNDYPIRLPNWAWLHRARTAVQSTPLGQTLGAFKGARATTATATGAESPGFWHTLSLRVMRYPWRFFIPVLGFLLLLGAPFLSVRLGAPDASILPKYVPSRSTYDLLQTRFDANETNPIVLSVQSTNGDVLTPANLAALDALSVRLAQDPRVRRVDSVVTLDPRLTLEQYQLIYGQSQVADPFIGSTLKQLVVGDTTIVNVISKYGMIDPRSEALVQDIRATHFAGMKVLVTGGTAGVVDYVNTMYGQFPWAILAVAITTYLVLMLLFQSVILPLKALAMNTLSILSAYGALVFIFQQGHFDNLLGFTPLGFVEASAPILMFCALFGLSMDYEVFLLSRVREEWLATGDNVHSVALGMERSGAIITSAAAIVVIVSGGFITADIILVKSLGVGMALAVLMDATLVRGLLVPATMRLLGKWNWWWPFGKVRSGGIEGDSTDVVPDVPPLATARR
ncbi:MAG: MMPL family transporter [Ktedonobacterales bacterium]|nr:MMPL family transporter [Ktedonobacterales bacterium]